MNRTEGAEIATSMHIAACAIPDTRYLISNERLRRGNNGKTI